MCGLPIDTDIVEVERRLYRDGTSKYLINGKTARLRDIRELFLDTGIGSPTPIPSSNRARSTRCSWPARRNAWRSFEEAAGIAKYKQCRIEAHAS